MNKFIPEPYCSTQDALKTVYRHLFPEPCNDTELQEALETKIAELRQRAEEATEADLAPLPPPSLSENREVMRRAALRESILGKPTERLGLWKARMRETADHLATYAKNVRRPLFLDISAFLPPDPLSPNRLGGSIAVKAIPDVLTGFAVLRWHGVLSTVRGKLFSGDIIAYYPCSRLGMTEFRNRNYWLDDKDSGKSLTWGKGALVSWRGQQVELRFNKNELIAAFPLFGASEAPKKANTKANRTAGYMIEHYPAGKPPHLTIDAWRRDVEGETGESIDAKTFSRAANLAGVHWADDT